MGERIDLHHILQSIIGVRSDGKSNVYFQPPSTVNMNYPCILYNREFIEEKHADNTLYSFTKRYAVTVIDYDPDSVILDKILALPMCSFDRHFTADNLNHDTYVLYF